MQGSSDETANSGEDGSSGPGSSSGQSDGSSHEVNSSHASQSAGSPGSELQSEDIADIEALKEEEEEEKVGSNPERGSALDTQKERRSPAGSGRDGGGADWHTHTPPAMWHPDEDGDSGGHFC